MKTAMSAITVVSTIVSIRVGCFISDKNFREQEIFIRNEATDTYAHNCADNRYCAHGCLHRLSAQNALLSEPQPGNERSCPMDYRWPSYRLRPQSRQARECLAVHAWQRRPGGRSHLCTSMFFRLRFGLHPGISGIRQP